MWSFHFCQRDWGFCLTIPIIEPPKVQNSVFFLPPMFFSPFEGLILFQRTKDLWEYLDCSHVWVLCSKKCWSSQSVLGFIWVGHSWRIHHLSVCFRPFFLQTSNPLFGKVTCVQDIFLFPTTRSTILELFGTACLVHVLLKTTLSGQIGVKSENQVATAIKLLLERVTAPGLMRMQVKSPLTFGRIKLDHMDTSIWRPFCFFSEWIRWVGKISLMDSNQKIPFYSVSFMFQRHESDSFGYRWSLPQDELTDIRNYTAFVESGRKEYMRGPLFHQELILLVFVIAKGQEKARKKRTILQLTSSLCFFLKFGSTQHRKRLLFFSKQGLKVILSSLFVYIVMLKGTFMAKSFHNCPGPDRGYGWTWWDSKRDRGTQRVFECLRVRWGSWRLLLW